MRPEDLARRQKRALLERDRALARDLAGEYRKVWERIRSDLDRLVGDITAARAAGEDVGPSWLFRQDRLARLERDTAVRIDGFARAAAGKVTAGQAEAAAVASADAAALMVGVSAGFVPALPERQIDLIVGRSSAGQPLGLLLDRLGPDAAGRARRALVDGVALGRNPRVIAAEARQAFAGSLTRALVVARTEVLGVYRQATLESYRANRDVVAGWVWLAELGPRTCAVCVAMHGSFHSLDETLDSHPSCRCTMVPSAAPVSSVRPGPDWFAEQPEDVQRRILGPGKLAAYRDGRVSLPGLVEETLHPVWGRGRRERSLRAVLA